MAATTDVNSPAQTSADNLAPMVQAGQPVQATQQPVQAQNVYMMPAHLGGKPTRIVRPVPGVKCLSIATIVIGSVLVLLGIVAVVLKAHNSYIGNPIWTGLLFMVTTGTLGIFVHKKQNNFCMNIGFLVMTIVSAIFAYQLMECAWFFVGSEGGPYDGCYPAPHQYDYPCGRRMPRILVGIAVVLCAIAALVLCIVSCSVTMYGTFTCCYNCCTCCRKTTTSTMVQYSPHTGIVMAPMSGQGAQVMVAPHMIQQGLGTQQPTSQPLYYATAQPNLPPAYTPVPVAATSQHAFVVSSDQQVVPGVVPVPPGNPSDPSAVENKPLVPDGETVQDGTQIADNPQNWQKF